MIIVHLILVVQRLACGNNRRVVFVLATTDMKSTLGFAKLEILTRVEAR